MMITAGAVPARPVTGKILTAIRLVMQFLTINQHVITKFSCHMSNYVEKNLFGEPVGTEHLLRSWPTRLEPPLSNSVAIWLFAFFPC